MKKFIVAFLSLFTLLGASILYACGPTNIELSLSQQSVSLQLNGTEEAKVATIIADVTGTDDKSISLDFVYDDDIISPSVSQNSQGQSVITLTATNEGSTELVVTTKQGSVKKSIYIEVYTEVTSMIEKKEDIAEGEKSTRFLIKNDTYQTLDANSLISFTPSTSTRKNVVWTFEASGTTEYNGANIVGNQIYIPQTFSENEVVLRATSANNPDVYVPNNITIPVIEQITIENIRLGASIYATTGFDYTTTANGEPLGEVSVEITPNLSQYEDSGDPSPDGPHEDIAYIKVETELTNSLELIPTITDVYGNPSNLLTVLSENTTNGYIFSVKASRSSVNQDFYVSFKIGYKNYDYSIDISSAYQEIGQEYGRILVEAADKIEKVSVLRNNIDASLNTQTLYSHYASNVNSGYGQLYNVKLTPDTVLWGENGEATGEYTISLPAQEGDINPIKAYYRLNGVYTEIGFTLENGVWTSEKIASTSSLTFEHNLYLKANEEYFAEQSITFKSGILLTFASIDNPRASTATVEFNIVKTADEMSITGENDEAVSEISINSTTATEMQFIFILHGQTTVDGLSVNSNSQYVEEFGSPEFISTNGGENVRFSITIKLKNEYIGLTNRSTSFTIRHENGTESLPITLNIYFPLTNATVSASNTSASIVMNNQSSYIISNDGINLNGSLSAGVLMLKNGTTTPLIHSYNTSSNGKEANATVSVNFYDFDENNEYGISLQDFLALYNSTSEDIESNLQTIIDRAVETNSNVVTFDSYANNNLRTTHEGYTYIVFTYQGIGEGAITASFKRVVLVHSYNAVESFNVNPASDRNFTLYASDSVGETGDTIQKTITVSYSSNAITYKANSNFKFITEFAGVRYTGTIDDNSRVIWYDENNNVNTELDKYFQITAVPQDTHISFTVYAISTNGQINSPHTIYLQYILTSGNAGLNNAGLNDSTSPYEAVVSFTIINADRVEEVIVDGVDEDGIYFEIGSLTSTSQFVIVQTGPSNAKNTGVSYVVANKNGEQTSPIVNVTALPSVNTRLKIDLLNTIQQGTSGALYIFPTDAVNNGIINYQFTNSQGEIERGTLNLADLGKTRSDKKTNFEYLIENAFFTNNQGEQISFANIFKKVKIEVADGRSFAHAFRVYDETGFDHGDGSSTYFYSVMNDISVGAGNVFDNFTGGVQGYNNNSDITITLTGSNFANTLTKNGSEGGQIRDISFNGNVTGTGFVVGTNNGTITNVTVDTNGLYSSVLTGNDSYVGGIAGINGKSGTITDVSVLGLQINAENYTVGGVAGQNKGTITIARVEFYNLANTENTEGTKLNTFKGSVVGGVIGEQQVSGTISQVYAYDYILTNNTSNARLNGAKVGAIVGNYTASGQLAFVESFAVVDNLSTLENFVGSKADSATLSFANSYIGYYNDSNTYTFVYSMSDGENSDFANNSERIITSSDANFNKNINGGNAYLRYFYQDEKVSTINSTFNTVLENNLYKAIQTGSSLVFFRNNINVGTNSLSTSQSQDYKELNTISIADLLEGYNKNIIVSSNSSSVIVSGSELFIQSIGQGKLTIYSKQDVSVNIDTDFVVDKALSTISLISENATGTVEHFAQDSETTVNIQKSKSRLFVAGFTTTSVYLGLDAQEFELDMLSNFAFSAKNADAESSITETKDKSSFTQISSTTFSVVSNGDSATTYTIYPVLSDMTSLQGLVDVTITINPVDGAIAIGYDGDEISMSPSTVAYVNVTMETTDANDTVAPQMSLVANGVETKLTKKAADNTFTFYKPQDTTPIFTVTRSAPTTDSSSGMIQTKEFSFRFEVADEYKDKLNQDEQYSVSFVSSSQFTSGSLTINLARQGITKADVTNFKVDQPSFNNGITSYTTLSTSTGVMAPGTSSILHASVNPAYAYYDYMEVTVTGAPIASAVVFIPVEKTNSNLQYRTTEDITFETLSNGFRFTPASSYTSDEYGGINPKYDLYFHATFNRAIPEDCTLTVTATYYVFNKETGEAQVVDYVNTFIFVSYLAEPTITVDGYNSTLLAKGGSAELKIAVNLDQEIESINITNASQGIEYKFIEETIDQVNNKRIYTYNLQASVLAASTTNDNRIYIKATVIRRLNNNIERKTTTATVTLVDFKIDADETYVEGAVNGVLNVYANINQTVSLHYVFDPETINYDTSNSLAVDAYKEIMEARDTFERNHSYPATDGGTITGGQTADYLINVEEREVGGRTEYHAIPLEDRMWYVVGNSLIPIKGADAENSLFDISVDEESGEINIKAKTLTQASQEMLIRTYVTTNGETRTIETYFTLQVTPWTSLDLPSMITSAQEFLSLAESEGEGMYDYILMNDIVLEDYTPFNTDYISSLDGNGFTIHIKSFNTTAESSVLNLALFNTVNENTTLKNLRVNLYNGGQVNVDLNSVSTLNMAGFAITNNGIITNSEVVSFYTDRYAIGPSGLNENATNQISGDHGININYTRGSTAISMSENSSWISRVAGFVLTNNGNITNSRVGGDEIVELLEVDPTYNNQITARITALDNFTIKAQGQVAGFVLENQGSIAASFVKNLAINNESKTAREGKAYAVGFVGTNTGKILTSYVEGVKQTSTENKRVYARTGSQIATEQAVIAGFVLTNSGEDSLIENSYSNIMISNGDVQNGVYLASGFVYRNEGRVANCYSASQIENQRYSQMNFSGLSPAGELLADGEYENCYYYNMEYDSTDANTGSSTESDFDTNVLMIPDPSRSEYFYGFSIATYGGEDGIWAMDTNAVSGEGLQLLEPNDIAISYRFVNYLEYNADGSINTDGEYQLPYGIIYVTDGTTEYQINPYYGSDSNPIIIRTAQEFIEITGASESTPIQEQYKETIHGTYRLVGDIDMSAFSSQIMSLPSTQSAFSGKLYGNGFTISGLSLSYNGNNLAYGLFKSIEPYTVSGTNTTYYPRVVGLHIETSSNMLAADTTFVGTLAGYIKDAMIVNVSVTYSNGAMVQGRNFVGGIAGLISGDSIVKNITITNPNITAVRNASTGTTTFEVSDINTFRNSVLSGLNYTYTFTGSDSIATQTLPYSYAGGVAGYVDIYSSPQSYFTYTTTPEYNVTVVRVLGTVNITGQVAGGLFGLTAHQTFVEDAGITIKGQMSQNTSHILSIKDYAGGVIGQSFGYLSKLFATHEDDVQQAIEDNIASFYTGNTSVERGILNLFMAENQSSTSYTQKAIGGLVGFVGSGILQTSYAKINVISTSAQSAGGLVGEINLTGARSYHYETLVGDGYSKFLFHETYATGDVRAYTLQNGTLSEGLSGGIVGKIGDSSDRITFLATNAINFFTNIDYRTNQPYDTFATKLDDIDATAIGANGTVYRANYVYQFVGGATKNVVMSTAVTFAQAKNISGAEGAKSIGYVQSYVFDGDTTPVVINLYNGYSFSFYGDDILQPVESISTYTNGSAGYQATQKVFLNSMVWDTNNWIHNSDQIFPEIKYSIGQPTTIYLDCYNIAEVLQMMTENNNLNVIVRGLTSADSTEYSDVDISTYQATYLLSGFSGTISSSENYIDTVKGRQVRLIISNSLFESTAGGFTMDSVHIQVGEGAADSDDANLQIEGGIISKAEMELATLNNISLYIKKAIDVQITAEGDAGLIAPVLDGTSIESFRFFIDTGLATDTTIMAVKASESASTPTNLNVGLIAGRAEQNTTTSPMNIYNVQILYDETSGASGTLRPLNAISVDVQASQSANIGLFFGSISKANRTDVIRIADCNMSLIMPNYKIKINGKGLAMQEFGSQAKIGGFVGHVAGLDSLTLLSAGDEQTTELEITVPDKSSVGQGQSLYVGGMFGTVGGANSNGVAVSTAQIGTSDPPTITLDVKITPESSSGSTYGSIYFGGVAGRTTRALPVNNMTINLTAKVVGSQNSYIGGAVGMYNSADATVIQGLTTTTTIQGSTTETIDIGSAYLGGMFGSIGAPGMGDGSGSTVIIQGTDDPTLQTTSNPNTSKLKIEDISATSPQIGGIVGYTAEGTEIENYQIMLDISNITSNNASKTGYNGSTNIGGVVGSATNSVKMNNIKVTTGTDYSGINISDKAEINFAVGSMLGYSTSKILSDGKLYSNMPINYTQTESSTDTGLLYFGGLFGYQHNNLSSGDNATSIGDGSSAYTGNITASLIDKGSTIYLGGIFGNVKVGQLNTNITTAIFGGKIIVKHNHNTISNKVYIGGTIANVDVPNGALGTVTISRAINYGDVFIDYGENTTARMSTYTFGGIIGHINSNDKFGTLKDSYSMVTNHNSRLAGSGANSVTSDMTGALVGSGTLSDDSLDNYYNSAVCLAYDDQGTDIGYTAAGNGYNATDSTSNIIDKVYNQTLSQFPVFSYFAFPGGTIPSKLKPTTLSTDNNTITTGSGYNVTYYTISDDTARHFSGKTLSNVAIVGNFGDVTLSGPISSIGGYSSISGINFKIEYDDDNDDNNISSLGGLVNIMGGNAIIYGVGVNGSMSIGGESVIKIGGIVGSMVSGLIAESYTSLDMIYRARTGGTMSAIANYSGTNPAFIEYTYATGSVASYISANLSAFVTGTANLYLSNCYTITKLDSKDYVNGTVSGITLAIKNSASLYEFHADYNAINSNAGNIHQEYVKNDESKFIFNTSEFLNESNNIVKNGGNDWVKEINFNYGYPTRGFTYLKQSSWSSTTVSTETATTDDPSYDDYVKETSYIRQNNGVDNGNTFLIPNIGVLDYVLTTSGLNITSMALMYDVDLSATQFVTTTNNNTSVNWTTRTFDNKKFDGQNHTITGLNTSLFNSIAGGVVRNLRLTEANVKGTVSNTPEAFGLLANTMTGSSVVSNITLEGEIGVTSSTAGLDLGSLIGRVNGGNINTVTSLLKITYTNNNSAASFGGIVGHIEGDTINSVDSSEVTIAYCSNYGPITGQQKARAAGGIVGSTDPNRENAAVKIDYCYNGGSVLAGYTGTNDDGATYYAGGIIGLINCGGSPTSNTTVSNCYNAGVIKAGNKSHTTMAYAAGIAADSDAEATTTTGNGAYITNCYNEGSIEALGLDPTTSIERVNMGTADTPMYKVQVKQTSAQNVSAYLIANIDVTNCSSAGIKSTGSGENITETVDTNYLKRNGAALAQGAEYYSVDFKSKIDDYTNFFLKDEHTFYYYTNTSTSGIGFDRTSEDWKGLIIYDTDSTHLHENYFNFTFQLNKKYHDEEVEATAGEGQETEKQEASFITLQYGTNNIPVAFAEYQEIKVDMSYMSCNEGNSGHAGGLNRFMAWSLIIYDLFSYPNDGGSYNTQVNKTIYQSGALIASTNTVSPDRPALPTKSDFVSGGTSYSNDNNVVTIGGTDYIMLDGYNQTVFVKNTNMGTFTVSLTGSGFDTAKSNYRISDISLLNESDESILSSYYISNVEKTNSGVDVTIQVYATETLNGAAASATVEYSKTQQLSINADSAFVYTDENSFAIDLNKVSITDNNGTPYTRQLLEQAIIKGGSLTVGTGENAQTYDNVVVLKDKDLDNNNDYYFVYNSTSGMLTYYFNATYDTGSKVNKVATGTKPITFVEAFPTSFTVTRATSESVDTTFGATTTSHTADATTTTEHTINSGTDTDIDVKSGKLQVGEANSENVRLLTLNGETVGSITGADADTSFTLTLNSNVERFIVRGHWGTHNFSIYKTKNEEGERGVESENGTTYIDDITDLVLDEGGTTCTVTLNTEENRSKNLGVYLTYVDWYAVLSDCSDGGTIISKDASTLIYTPASGLYTETLTDTKDWGTIEKTYQAVETEIDLDISGQTSSYSCTDNLLFGRLAQDENGQHVTKYVTFDLSYELTNVKITNTSGSPLVINDAGKMLTLQHTAQHEIASSGDAVEFSTYAVNDSSTTFDNSDTISITYGENYENEEWTGDFYQLDLVFANNTIDWTNSSLTWYKYAPDDENSEDGFIEHDAQEITDEIKNAITTASYNGLNYIFINSDTFPNMQADKTMSNVTTLNLGLTYSDGTVTFDAFTITSESNTTGSRDTTNVNDNVYSTLGTAFSTPFQNATEVEISSFTDSATASGSASLSSETVTVPDALIILTDDAFVRDYISTPSINANGHALIVAHDDTQAEGEEEETERALFESLTNVSNAYIAGNTRVGLVASTDDTGDNTASTDNTGGNEEPTLKNIKLFGSVIKAGVASGEDFLGISGTGLINYMAIVNDGSESNKGITISNSQTLKGLIVAANGITNVEGGSIDISSATASGVILKAGDGANGTYGRFREYIKNNDGSITYHYNYVYYFLGIPWDVFLYKLVEPTAPTAAGGTITSGENAEVESVLSYSGAAAGIVSAYNAEGGYGNREGTFNTIKKYGPGYDDGWETNQTGNNNQGSEIEHINLEFRIAHGVSGQMVNTAVSQNCKENSTWYIVAGQHAEDYTAGIIAGSNIWLGMGRGDLFDMGYHNLWWFKYLFVNIMYKEGGNETDTVTGVAGDEQIYLAPTAAAKGSWASPTSAS